MENKFVKSNKRLWLLFAIMTAFIFVIPRVSVEGSQLHSNPSRVVETIDDDFTPNIVRHGGQNRANVAENVAKTHFSDADKVILVNQTKFPDAISATNISQGKYPVLYTYEGHVRDSTIELIQSMSLKEIYIMGGTSSVKKSVIDQLKKSTNAKITRLSGKNRYEVNVNAIQKSFTRRDHVVIAGGGVYADALYGVPFANTLDAPVVLTRTNKLDNVSVNLLKKLGVKEVTIIGGPNTVSYLVENQLKDLGIKYSRFAGMNRYTGSEVVARRAYTKPQNIVVASGEVFSDALVSAPVAQKLNAPILLVRSNSVRDEVLSYLADSRLYIENINIHGGPSTVSRNILEKISDLTSYEIRTTTIPFKTRTIEDNDLLEGETRVIQPGEDGIEKEYIHIYYRSGNMSSGSMFHKESVTSIDEIIAHGTKPDLKQVNKVDKMIKNLPENITLNHKVQVNDARNAYESLTSKQKFEILNLKSLESAEEQIVKLESIHKLTVSISPVEGGIASVGEEYEAGSNVLLQATPNENYIFKNWLVDGIPVGEESNFTFKMPNEDTEIIANFESVSEAYLSFNSSTGTITGYDSVGGRDVTIPSSIDGVEVRSIGSSAFDNKNITSVNLPNTIISIKNSAFSDNLLNDIELPDSLTTIGAFAFNNNLITNVTIPEGVEEIDIYAFNRNLLQIIDIPDSVLRIGRNAFSYNNLRSIRLPKGLEIIESNSFANNSLKTVNIPSSVIRIDNSAFHRNELATLEIPSSVETIGANAFTNNALSEVIFNEGLLRIENSAFSNNQISEIILPKSLVSVGNQVFWTWTNHSVIQRVTIGEEVVIGDNLFNLNNSFLAAYVDSKDGGAGTYNRTQDDNWIKQ